MKGKNMDNEMKGLFCDALIVNWNTGVQVSPEVH